MKGIIFLEKSGNVYSMYFIETAYSDLMTIVKAKDSVDVFSLDNHNCDAGNVDVFQEYFFKKLHYKSASFKISAENHLGQHYEDSVSIYSTYGSIKYLKDNRYKMTPTNWKLTINNNEIIFTRRENILIEAITSR